MRTCTNCYQMKPYSEYYKKLNGYQYRCKKCNAEVVRAYNKRSREKKMALKWANLRGET